MYALKPEAYLLLIQIRSIMRQRLGPAILDFVLHLLEINYCLPILKCLDLRKRDSSLWFP